MGKNCDSPCQFVICWSEDGCENARNKTKATGFVAHLIAVANELRIPVFNLANADAENRLFRYLEIDDNVGANLNQATQTSLMEF